MDAAVSTMKGQAPGSKRRWAIGLGVGAVALEELLISTLLYIQGSNYADLVRSTPKPSGRAAVRRSLEYIEQHLAEPISLADLSRHSGMSARSIQAGFRDDLGTASSWVRSPNGSKTIGASRLRPSIRESCRSTAARSKRRSN